VAACGVGGGTGTDNWTASPNIGNGQSYQKTFTGAGTYVYYCSIHGYTAMHGTITITGGQPPPVAMFTFSPQDPTTGQSVTFDASSSSAPPGDTITAYHWNFGDGTKADTTTATTTHAYASASTFTATLTVTDGNSVSSGPFQAQVTVTGAPVDTPPTAAFAFSPPNPVAGQTVTFDASATTDQDGDPIAGYAWNFGDGTTASGGATITHTYAGAGMFAVTLVATDGNGNHSAPLTEPVTVTMPASAGGSTSAGGGGVPGGGGGSQGGSTTTSQASKLRLAARRLCKKRRPKCKLSKARLTFRLSAAAAVTIVIERNRKPVRHTTIRGRAGSNSLRLSAAGLRPGRYLLVLTPGRGKPVTLKFAVVAA
jgi:PKD repeat protein